MANCTTKANIDPKLRHAIRAALRQGSLEIGAVVNRCAKRGFAPGAARDGIKQMLYARELLVGWPLSRVDLDTEVSLLDLRLGRTTSAQLIEQMGPWIDRDVSDAAGRREMAWILYMEEADGTRDIPPITTTYAERDLADPNRPENCNLPFGPIIPPEMIELVAWFSSDRLVDSAIRVHIEPPGISASEAGFSSGSKAAAGC